MTPSIYVFIRTDIPIADQLCQVGHVCLEAGKVFSPPNHTHIVVLAVKDESSLMKLSTRLEGEQIKFVNFYEPDDDMGITSIATEVLYDRKEVFKRHRLWVNK